MTLASNQTSGPQAPRPGGRAGGRAGGWGGGRAGGAHLHSDVLPHELPPLAERPVHDGLPVERHDIEYEEALAGVGEARRLVHAQAAEGEGHPCLDVHHQHLGERAVRREPFEESR